MEKETEEKIKNFREKEDNLNKAREEYRQARISAQASCEHENVVEGDYEEYIMVSTHPPFRVCTSCGYAEEGWYCGYTFLDDKNIRNVTNVERDKAMKYVKGRIIPNTEHVEVNIGRKELTDILSDK